MGETNIQKESRVFFPAYCRAFDVVENLEWETGVDMGYRGPICNALAGVGGVDSITYLNRGETGDGYVYVPSYRIVAEQLKSTGSLWLNQKGLIVDGDGKGKNSVSPDRSKLFIAGAFGMSELTPGTDVDKKAVYALKRLYQECVSDEKNCLKSPSASNLHGIWKSKLDKQEEFNNKKRAVIKLEDELRILQKKIGGDYTSEERASNAKSIEELQKLELDLNKKIIVAKQLLEKIEAENKEKTRLLTYFNDAWRLADSMVDWATRENAWYNRIDEKQLLGVLYGYSHLRTAPDSLQGLRDYETKVRQMLIALVSTHTGREAAKHLGNPSNYLVVSCDSWTTKDMECETGSGTYSWRDCSLITGEAYRDTNTRDNGCEHKKIFPDKYDSPF